MLPDEAYKLWRVNRRRMVVRIKLDPCYLAELDDTGTVFPAAVRDILPFFRLKCPKPVYCRFHLISLFAEDVILNQCHVLYFPCNFQTDSLT